MIIGPWKIKLRNPVVIYRRPGKDWICRNAHCERAYGKLRRLSASGSCDVCGAGMIRVNPPRRG